MNNINQMSKLRLSRTTKSSNINNNIVNKIPEAIPKPIPETIPKIETNNLQDNMNINLENELPELPDLDNIESNLNSNSNGLNSNLPLQSPINLETSISPDINPILDTSPDTSPDISASQYSPDIDTDSYTKIDDIETDTDVGFFSSIINYIKSISMTTWIIIGLILLLVIINIFVFLSKRGFDFNKVTTEVLSWFGYVSLETTKTAVDITKTSTNIVADTTKNILTDIEKKTGIKKNIKDDNESDDCYDANDEDNKPQYKIDDPHSNIQSRYVSGKVGWCLIGEADGYRTCAEVKEKDICMSKQVYPTNAVCMNPRLRA